MTLRPRRRPIRQRHSRVRPWDLDPQMYFSTLSVTSLHTHRPLCIARQLLCRLPCHLPTAHPSPRGAIISIHPFKPMLFRDRLNPFLRLPSILALLLIPLLKECRAALSLPPRSSKFILQTLFKNPLEARSVGRNCRSLMNRPRHTIGHATPTLLVPLSMKGASDIPSATLPLRRIVSRARSTRSVFLRIRIKTVEH